MIFLSKKSASGLCSQAVSGGPLLCALLILTEKKGKVFSIP